MARIYYGRITLGIMTLEEVPARWRAKVKVLLDADKDNQDSTEGVQQ